MINKIKISIVWMLIINSTSYAQGNWELLIPSPTSNQMVGIYFIDEYTGWSVGESGTILKSTDGGETWNIKEIPWTVNLSDVHFPAADTGYVVGSDGFISKSTDGGDTWYQLDNEYVNNINRILFINSRTGWVICEKGLILYTNDGGETWEQQYSNTQEELLGIDNIGTKGLCIVGSRNTILTTQNNGQEWSLFIYGTAGTHHFYDVYFQNEKYGWIGGTSILLKTSNGGETWIDQNVEEVVYEDQQTGVQYHSPMIGFPFKQVYFFDDRLTGIAHIKETRNTPGNVTLQTKDGGKNWYAYTYGSFEQTHTEGRLCVLSENRVVSTGYHGDFRYSSDKGETWHFFNEEKRWWRDLTIGNHGKLISSQYELIEPDDEQHGNYNVRQLLRSHDYGSAWYNYLPLCFNQDGDSLRVDPASFVPGRYYDDQGYLWTVNDIGFSTYLCVSQDFGLTYHEFCRDLGWNSFIGLTQDADLIFLTSDTLAYYSVDRAEIAPGQYKSTFIFNFSYDSGRTFTAVQNSETWNNITPPTKTIIKDCYFLNGLEGFLIGRDGNILKTTDTGQNWENIYSGVVETLWDMEFLDKQTGFVTGNFGRILKTEDGGLTWRKTNSGTQDDIYCISFINDNEGWVGTEKGLRYTTDGGETWQGVPLRYAHGVIKNITFDSEGNGYAYTLFNDFYGNLDIMDDYSITYVYLLRLTDYKMHIDDQTNRFYLPQGQICLYPNYPNPFNSRTQIEYYIPKSGQVQIKIFDIRGRLVRLLVNQTQKSGQHSVIWDGRSNLKNTVSSGMYLYQLQSNNQTKNQKLLFLK